MSVESVSGVHALSMSTVYTIARGANSQYDFMALFTASTRGKKIICAMEHSKGTHFLFRCGKVLQLCVGLSSRVLGCCVLWCAVRQLTARKRTPAYTVLAVSA